MKLKLSRRDFVAQIAFASTALPLFSFKNSLFLEPIPIKGLKIGYSAITWGGNDIQAIKDISSLGYKGIQIRSNILKEYQSKPEALSKILKEYKLEFPMFSSGNADINTGNDEGVIKTHTDNAKFVKATGGTCIQLTNSSRPKDGNPRMEDLQKYGKLMNEIGKQTKDLGIQATYHNHMHQLGETPEEVDIILENCDPENVMFLLDVAHYHQGGGDPVKAIRKYKDRIKALHLKDVRPKSETNPKAYTFVELGQGKVNFPGIFNALEQIKFKGWGIVELDSVPEKEKTPLQCGEISRAFLKSSGIAL